MKLSEVLERFYVLPLNQSEIVGFSLPEELSDDVAINVYWKDSDAFDEHNQYFNDQDVQLLDHPTGGFFVTDVGGEMRGFIALDGVDLEKVE